MKPETWQKDRASYPFVISIDTRYQDLDPNDHINNVAMAAFFETGRVRFMIDLFGAERSRAVVGAVSIAYLNEATFPAAIEVASGTWQIGNSSWVIASAAFQQQKDGALLCVACCRSTLVCVGEAGPVPIPPQMRNALESRMVRLPS